MTWDMPPGAQSGHMYHTGKHLVQVLPNWWLPAAGLLTASFSAITLRSVSTASRSCWASSSLLRSTWHVCAWRKSRQGKEGEG